MASFIRSQHRRHLLLLLFFLLIIGTLTVKATKNVDETIDALVHWIESQGGSVDSRQVVRREDPADPSSLRGVFATEDIPARTVIVDLPQSTILSADMSRGDTRDMCGCIAAVKRELKLGPNKSKFGPYISILDYDVTLPDVYSNAGQKLFLKVLGPHMRWDFNLGRHIRWFTTSCGVNTNKDPLALKAMLLVVARSCGNPYYLGGSSMAPYYDLYNHANGHNANTITKHSKNGFYVTTSRDIKAGEQLFNSYGSGTTHLLSSYGFVEQHPQLWTFHIPAPVNNDGVIEKIEVKFSTYEDYDGNLNVSFKGEGASGEALSYAIDFLKFYDLNRLKSIKEEIDQLTIEDKVSSQVVPAHEGQIIHQFYYALINAIKAAVKAEAMISNTQNAATTSSDEL